MPTSIEHSMAPRHSHAAHCNDAEVPNAIRLLIGNRISAPQIYLLGWASQQNSLSLPSAADAVIGFRRSCSPLSSRHRAMGGDSAVRV
jgi:hypothetical protein